MKQNCFLLTQCLFQHVVSTELRNQDKSLPMNKCVLQTTNKMPCNSFHSRRENCLRNMKSPITTAFLKSGLQEL